ncbi:hypothetical protein Tco_0077754 [Tanacetum coccineum]
MYYPCFTKVIVNFFMTKDSSIPRRNSVNWHFARDDPMFTTIKVVSRHEDTQLYGAILPDELTNEAIKDSESYKEYYAIASGAEPPKTKASVKKKQAGSDKTKTPPTAKGKRLKTSAKAAKPAKKKQPAKTSKAKGLIVLSEVALTEAEQMKLATKRIDEEDDNDDNDDDDDNDDVDNQDGDGQYDNGQEYDGQDYEGQDDDNEKINSDNDGDDFIHPKFSTHDQEEKQDDENKEEEWSDDEAYDDKNQANELYRDMNVNLEGRDTEMTDASCTIVQTTQVIEDTHVIITPVNPEEVPSLCTVEMPPLFCNSQFLQPPHFSYPTSATNTCFHTNNCSKYLPTKSSNLNSVFKFEDRVKALEDDFSEFKQTNQFAAAVSSIPEIIDTYLANKMNEAVKIAVQLHQGQTPREEAQNKSISSINLMTTSRKSSKSKSKPKLRSKSLRFFHELRRL